MKKFILAWVLLSTSIASHAWDGAIAGKINTVDVAPLDGENFGFRVTLMSNQPLCGNSNAWAYINKSDDNYAVAVSVLLAAKMSEKDVVIYSTQATRGYCHIGYVSLR